jgi:voltage-gated potassium channel
MRSKFWSDIFEVVFSLVLAMWIPIRILYFSEDVWFDYITDLTCWGWFVVETRREKRLKFSSLIWAIPFLSISAVAPYKLIFPSAWLLLAKYLFVPRILKVRSVLEQFDSLHPVFYRLISIGTFLPVIIHGQACIWIALGSGTAGPDPDHVSEYIKGVYWTLTTLTTIGYGDISAKTNPQMIFSIFAEVVGVGFFGYVLSNVASLLARLDAAREHYLTTLDSVEAFVRKNELPPEFRAKIRGYYRYLWEQHSGSNDQSILDSLPRLLKSEATFLMNKDIVPKVPFLKNAPQDLLEDLVFQLKPIIATPDEHLFYRGEVGDTMFFIHHGQVDILGENDQVLVSLKDGAFFGEMALLLDAPRSATAIARTYCDLFILEKSAFESVMKKHPSFRSHIEEVVQSRMKKAA